MSSVEHSQTNAVVTGTDSTSGQLPPPPVVPPNVTDVGLPETSDSIYDDGTTLDYVPLAMFCEQSECSGKITSIGPSILGIMTPEGNVEQPKWSYDGNYGDLLYILMLDPKSEEAQGTVIRQELYWQRISQSFVPPNTPHTTQIAVTSGISETEAEELSFSVGANVGFNNTITGSLSADLSKSFSQSVTISEETTVTDEFPFNAQPTEQVTGVYQLMQTFYIEPGDNLVKAIAALQANQELMCSGKMGIKICQHVEAVMPFVYPSSTYLQIFGVDSDSAQLKATMSTQQLISALTPKLEEGEG